MDLQELGALLKTERERRGLSENDVIDRIKIGRACLVAIEEGNKDGLPHPVYAKGFVKNYAKLLELDAEEIGEAFSAAVGVVQESNITPQHELNESVTPTAIGNGGGGSLRYVLVAAVILLGALGVLWFFSLMPFDFGRPTPPAPTSQASPPEPAGSALTEQKPLDKTVISEEPRETATASGVAAFLPGAESPATPVASADGQAAITPPLPESAPEASPSPAPDSTDPAAGTVLGADAEEPADPSLSPDILLGEHGVHSVTILAMAECWIDVSVDGGTTRGIMLTKGKRFVGRFNESLLVRLGNAGGVEVRYDDKNYPLQAAPGEVKTLKFVARANGDTPTGASASQATHVSLDPKSPVGTAPAAPAAPAKTGTPGTDVPGAVVPPSPGAVTPPAVPSGVSSTSPATAPPAAGADAAAAGSRSLDIVGADGSWVIITADGGKSKEVFIKKGQTLTEPYKEKIEVRLGNPSSVVFRHEGQEMPVSTQRGEVKTVRFPAP